MNPGKKPKRLKGAPKTIFLKEYRDLILELIQVRKSLGMNQTEVAEKAGWPDHTYISKIETFERRLDVVDLVRLSKIYNKSVGHFMDLLAGITIKK